MPSRLAKEDRSRSLYLRLDRFEKLYASLNPEDSRDFSILMILGTGLYPNQQRGLEKQGVLVEPEAAIMAAAKNRVIRTLPEFLPALAARFLFLQKIGKRHLLALKSPFSKGYRLVNESDVSARLKEIFKSHGWGLVEPLWRLRLTALIRMAQEGWGPDDITQQLGLPYRDYAWIWEPRFSVQENFWGGLPEAERHIRLRDIGRSIMTKKQLLTDPDLCQVYMTLNRLEADVLWRKPAFMTRLLLGGGLRIAEACRVRAQDVLLEYDPPVINVTGKGGRARGTQVIPEFAEHLRDYIKDMPQSITGFLFPAVNWRQRRRLEPQKPISTRAAFEWWQRVMKIAGVKDTHPHMARHTFASWEAERLPLYVLKDTLGHSTLVTTERFYRHGILGRNYSTDPPKWRKLAELKPERDASYKDPLKSRFVRRSLMIHP